MPSGLKHVERHCRHEPAIKKGGRIRPLRIMHTEASPGWGGQEIRVLTECIAMSVRGHEVAIAAPRQNPLFSRAEQAGLRVFATSFNKKNPCDFFRFRSILHSFRPDIVNTHSSGDSWIAGLAVPTCGGKTKVVRTRHLSTPISTSFLSTLVYARLADAIVTTGEAIRSAMIERNGFNPDRITSIPTGIDMNRFDPDKVKPSLPRNGFAFGAAGVLRSWKGHRFLIEALPILQKEIPDAHLYIAGDGPQRESLAALIREKGLDRAVTMLGHREDIPEVIASLDVLVHPSYDHEGVPQSMLQALALRRPVVATSFGALKEIIHDGATGLLVPPKDASAIAACVLRLYRDGGLRLRLGAAGREFVASNFSLDHMLDETERLYARLMND